MKKRKSKKLALNRLTVRPLDKLEAAQGGYDWDNISLGNGRCSVTEAGAERCMETM